MGRSTTWLEAAPNAISLYYHPLKIETNCSNNEAYSQGQIYYNVIQSTPGETEGYTKMLGHLEGVTYDLVERGLSLSLLVPFVDSFLSSQDTTETPRILSTDENPPWA